MPVTPPEDSSCFHPEGHGAVPAQSAANGGSSTSAKSPTAGGLDGPVYTVQNELSIRPFASF